MFPTFGLGFGSVSMIHRILPTIVPVAFVVIFCMIIVQLTRGVVQWNRNNHAPLLTVNARIVAKRQSTSHHTHHQQIPTGQPGHMQSAPIYSSSTSYFTTFELDGGNRLEFPMSGKEYGLLADGDVGKLSYQGTRYKGFVRSGHSYGAGVRIDV